MLYHFLNKKKLITNQKENVLIICTMTTMLLQPVLDIYICLVWFSFYMAKAIETGVFSFQSWVKTTKQVGVHNNNPNLFLL